MLTHPDNIVLLNYKIMIFHGLSRGNRLLFMILKNKFKPLNTS